MLPPATPLSGSGAQSAPICAAISRAMASNPPSSLTSSLKCGFSRGKCSACNGRDADGLLLGQPLALAAQQRSKAEVIVERSQSREIRSPRPQVRGRDAERHIAHDPRETPCEEDRVAMCCEALAESAAATQPKGSDAADVGVQFIERAEFAHQCRR